MVLQNLTPLCKTFGCPRILSVFCQTHQSNGGNEREETRESVKAASRKTRISELNRLSYGGVKVRGRGSVVRGRGLAVAESL